MDRRFFLHLWLAFLLVFAQQGAFAHALSHLQETPPTQSQSGKSLPHHDVCPQCAAYSHLGSAASPFLVALAPIQNVIALAFLLPQFFSQQIFQPYLSRAPPAFV